ncbi:MAG TPA: diacylglycerol kinase family protein [Pseudonocardiaceae bacterium]|nr:diacylglycerol kinase family protein [Pseudonocardiaceae bacterium]
MLALLVVNPHATATTAAGRDVLAHALASDVKLEVLETSYRGHAADAAAQAAADGFDLVVAHGGDGTVNEVVNGLMRAECDGIPARPMLGVVPGGSANVFAGALGLPREPVEATHHLLQAIEAGRSRRVGLGRVDDRWFTFNAGIGWDADVVAAVDSRRRKQASPVLYMRTALGHYVRQAYDAPDLTVEMPGEEPVAGVKLAVVCNTDPWTYLGTKPLRLIPTCSFDRGLGLFALHSLATPTVLRHIGQILRGVAQPKGKHLLLRDDVSHIRVTSARPVRVQVDGDVLGERESVSFMSVPAALRVAV